ncbi:translocation/assembly module TamB domain-containing protein [Diaphorobacter sp.]|uniref:translocation/assembly module TamB domain-containing protein n=1 Tax=Diaphorobacter sp. TaxID=1934310 RepID=UPI0028A718D3|nr:translocation/assembly module TamB domain-containing protein [Diaphorobacter sp.]
MANPDLNGSHDSAPATPDNRAPARPARSTGRRILRGIGWMLLALVLIIITVLGTTWWWAGRDDSLAHALQRAAQYLPEGQSLEARDVTGSVRAGGKIGALAWKSPTMKVELRDADIGWSLPPLLSRTLHLGKVHIAELVIESTPDSAHKEPTPPLEQLTLPLKIELPFQVDHIVWKGPPEAIVDGLDGHYAYDGTHHQLDVKQVRWADGNYQAHLKLQGASPMQLEAAFKGDLHVANPLVPEEDAPDTKRTKNGKPTPNTPDTIAVSAEAQASGTLATAAARIDVTAKASATPESSGSVHTVEPMRADVQASVMPWRPQPLLTADAHLHNVDVAAFWPQGPRTMLSGQLNAGPVDGGDAQQWQLKAQFDNTLRGPWDKQRLPLDSVTADVLYTGTQWQVKEAIVQVNQGRIAAHGAFTPATNVFEGEAAVQQLNPAELYSTLDAAPLQGTLQAKADEAQKVAFAVDLKAAAGAARANSKALRIQTLATKGEWQQPLLTLSQLKVQALQATVDASAVQYNMDTQDARAKLRADVPGAALQVDGRISPDNGQGHAALQLDSLPTVVAWTRTLPGVKDPLAGAKVEGKAQLQLDWNGGYGNLLQRLQAATGAALPASKLQLKAQVSGDNLRYQPADAPAEQAIQIARLALQLNGSPESADITLNTTARRDAQSLQLDTALNAGLATEAGAAPLDWHASIQRLQATAQPGKDQPGPWLARLQSTTPVRITQQTTGTRGNKVVLSTHYNASAGSLLITPPELGARRPNAAPLAPVTLAWDDTTATKAGDGHWAVRSAGRLQGIPLAWVDAFSPGDGAPPLAAAGLSGDLSFNGRWDLDTTGSELKATLTVERAGGDLRIAVDDGTGGTTVVRTSGPTTAKATTTRKVTGTGMRARIKDARIDVRAQGNNVNAKLLWDSERAGHATADLNTQLTQQDGAWTWAANAPLSGKVSARMPNIGIWALFAPPGWRVNGTLAADATISGNRSDPHWMGNINAADLNILSVLDGVDLQNGTLRAKIEGTRLDITELRIKGGKGSSARILGYSGNLTNAPEDGGELTGSGFAQWVPPAAEGQSGNFVMNLQAQATKLQVLVRADRQVSVSGPLQARLDNGQFVLRGNITVDRATIILPEESAPSLDKDVVVHTAASRKAEAEAAKLQQQKTAKANARAETRKLPDILVQLNMGRDFALQGFGITTRLRGGLEIKGANIPGGPPRITGEIRTEQGRYRAWGQSLDVESGLIRFNGPYDNPSLDILAIRPNIAVRAGVQVLGTARAPRVALYSDPDLPDAEKLSWVVMGRDPSTGGAESALLQQAALALLAGGNSGSGKIAGSLGLDEVGFRGPTEGTDASGAALTLGKRLSDKLYVTYEQSLSGAMGTIYIFYDLSRRLTLRGQTGATSAVDLIYTVRKD